jgi:hypothetical protein
MSFLMSEALLHYQRSDYRCLNPLIGRTDGRRTIRRNGLHCKLSLDAVGDMCVEDKGTAIALRNEVDRVKHWLHQPATW